MMRVVHYINQFFGGIGGEDQAHVGVSVTSEAVGPGKLLAQQLGAEGTLVGTIICGDNYFAEHTAEASQAIQAHLAALQPDLMVAGPAFNAGRYGMACAGVCKIADALGIPAVTGMYPENPGRIEHPKAYVVPTTINAAGMAAALHQMTALGKKLVHREAMGSAVQEGYLPRGIRKNFLHEKSAAERLVEQLAEKMAGRPYRTEIPLPTFDRVLPPEPVKDLAGLRLAVVTEAGLVPTGNPDRLESARAAKWLKYDLSERPFTKEHFLSVHGGFDNSIMNEDPNRGLPWDVLQELVAEKAIAGVVSQVYVTTGNVMAIKDAQRVGQEIAADLHRQNINAVLVTST